MSFRGAVPGSSSSSLEVSLQATLQCFNLACRHRAPCTRSALELNQTSISGQSKHKCFCILQDVLETKSLNYVGSS